MSAVEHDRFDVAQIILQTLVNIYPNSKNASKAKLLLSANREVRSYVRNPIYAGFAAGWIGLWFVFGHANAPIPAVAVVTLAVHLFVPFMKGRR
jgi:protein-S-isoprenylcysteine O-methyltransferase Ste14